METYYSQRCYKAIQLHMAKLEITQRCNSRCKTCNTWQIQNTTLSKGAHMKNELSLGDYEGLLEELKVLGCRHIEIHGGEPTLYRDLLPVVQKCTGLGFGTLLTTNGLSMTPGIARGLVEAGLNRINYSLDGPKECHNYLRGRNDAFEKMTAAMNMIKKADQKKRIVKNINTMVSSYNINRLEEILPLAAQYDIDIITYVHPGIINEKIVQEVNQIFGETVASYRIVGSAEFFISDLSLIAEKRELVKKEAKKFRVRVDKTNFFTLTPEEISRGIKRHPHPCWNIYGNVIVDAAGNVFPCEILRFHLGNVKENSLKMILQGERFEQLTKIYARNINKLNMCMYCVDSVYP